MMRMRREPERLRRISTKVRLSSFITRLWVDGLRSGCKESAEIRLEQAQTESTR